MNAKYLQRMPDEILKSYLLVAVDRATRQVFVAIKVNKTAASTRNSLNPYYDSGWVNNHQVADLRRHAIHGKSVCRT